MRVNALAFVVLLLVAGCDEPTGPGEPLTTADLTAVHGIRGGPVYAVGTFGVVLRKDQDGWSVVEPMDSFATQHRYDVWVGSNGDYSTVGLSEVSLDVYHAIWGDSSGARYIAGYHSGPARFALARAKGPEGWDWFGPTEFEVHGRYRSVWATSPSDVFLGGDLEVYTPGIGDVGLLHFDGFEWRVVELPADYGRVGVSDIHGTGRDDIFVVFLNGDILRYDGAKWHVEVADAANDLEDIWVVSPDLAYAVGGSGTILRYDGEAWQAQESGTSETLNGVWANGADEAYAVGYGGTILHFNGTRWIAEGVK